MATRVDVTFPDGTPRAFIEGWKAHERLAVRRACPYPRSKQRLEWQAGWDYRHKLIARALSRG